MLGRGTCGARRVADVGRIAALVGDGIGDLLFAMPALEALRARFPEAEIVVLGRPAHAELLSGRPGPADRVVVAPRPEDDTPEREAFLAKTAEEGWDLGVQLRGGGRHSNPFLRALRPRVSAGPRTPDAPSLDVSQPFTHYQNEVERHLETVSLVGAEPVARTPRLEVTPADLAEAESVLPDEGSPVALLHPSAGDPRRRWRPDGFAAVGNVLAACGASVAVTGAADDAFLTAAVVRGMRLPATDLAGRLSLRGLAGLASRASVFVGNDSGPLHVAAAAGAPTVGVYWCGNVINAGPPGRVRHRVCFSWRLACPVCGVDCTQADCEHAESFVADVPDAEVIAEAVDLLAASGSLIPAMV